MSCPRDHIQDSAMVCLTCEDAKDAELATLKAAHRKLAAYHLWATGPAFSQGAPYTEQEIDTIARDALRDTP